MLSTHSLTPSSVNFGTLKYNTDTRQVVIYLDDNHTVAIDDQVVQYGGGRIGNRAAQGNNYLYKEAREVLNGSNTPVAYQSLAESVSGLLTMAFGLPGSLVKDAPNVSYFDIENVKAQGSDILSFTRSIEDPAAEGSQPASPESIEALKKFKKEAGLKLFGFKK
ncbi:MAG: hypothetical protein QE263_01850 [Vampirovibrionales bacterium]|nr:hypothetical protein [Vampirovibrionales bacterium]